MSERESAWKPSAVRPTAGRACIVMACTDMSEADQVGRQLLKFNSGCLVTYRRAEDLMYNAPAGKVALLILATNDEPPLLRRVLWWLKRRWPKCPVTVVGNEGCGEHEMVAREGGANYLLRPVAPQQWSALLHDVLDALRKAEIEGAAQ